MRSFTLGMPMGGSDRSALAPLVSGFIVTAVTSMGDAICDFFAHPKDHYHA